MELPALTAPRARLALGVAALIVAAGWLAIDVATAPSPAAGKGPAVLPAAATSPTPTTAAPRVEEDVVRAAAVALEDWASFAGSGDLTDVEETLHTAGPQYRQLAAETATAAGTYRFDLGDHPQVALDGGHARVLTAVAFTTPAAVKTYDWELEMRRDAEGGWRLWTVHERSP